MYDLDYFEITLRLIISVGIGAAIGLERETNHQSAGLRTNIVVCVSACLLTIIQGEISYMVLRMGLENPDLQPMLTTDFARITAQIVSGIGFLGAGAIITTRADTISGLTTAATIWGVAGLGIAIGMGYYYLSLVSCLIILIVLYVLKRMVRIGEIFRLDIKVSDRDAIQQFHAFFKENKLKTTDEDFKMLQTNEGVIFQLTYNIYIPRSVNHNDIIDEFLKLNESIIEISFKD
ncbi:MgtC/SapB family protein [Jeotgalibaca ciconiae]|nr:MgtC/SapB family protein [Jeotgalibaca ciconiae]HJB22539.1 MgtC/SapB family protein [Candidatus Jeotgalibaca pullicola]